MLTISSWPILIDTHTTTHLGPSSSTPGTTTPGTPPKPAADQDREIRRALEDELRDPKNFVEYFLPRPLRLAFFGFSAASCLIACLINVARIAQARGLYPPPTLLVSPPCTHLPPSPFTQAPSELLIPGTPAATNLTINLIGLLTFASLFIYDQQAAEKRIERRKQIREAQIAFGDREVFVNEQGERMSRLKEVNDDWVLRRLERWGRYVCCVLYVCVGVHLAPIVSHGTYFCTSALYQQAVQLNQYCSSQRPLTNTNIHTHGVHPYSHRKDGMPFVGPNKGAILQRLVQEHVPTCAVEVGTLCGYSAIRIAQVKYSLSTSLMHVHPPTTITPPSRPHHTPISPPSHPPHTHTITPQALPPASKLISLERDWKWVLVAKRFLWQASQGTQGTPGLGDKVDVWWGDAIKKIPDIPAAVGATADERVIDFVFLDGLPREYLQYLQAVEPFLKPGAVVVADNAGVFAQGGLKPYLEYVRGGSGKYQSRFIESTLEWRDDVPDGLEVSVYLPLQ